MSDTLREKLAEYAHIAWAGWMKYLFDKGTFSDNGSWVMPEWAVTRWTRQMNTAYLDLSESEKKSDRKEADQMLKVLADDIHRLSSLDITHLDLNTALALSYYLETASFLAEAKEEICYLKMRLRGENSKEWYETLSKAQAAYIRSLHGEIGRLRELSRGGGK